MSNLLAPKQVRNSKRPYLTPKADMLNAVIMYPYTFKKVIGEISNIPENCNEENDSLNDGYKQFQLFSQSVSHACNFVKDLVEGDTQQNVDLSSSEEKEVAYSLLRQVEISEKTECFQHIIDKIELNNVKTKNLLPLSLLKLGACSPVFACEYRRDFTCDAVQ